MILPSSRTNKKWRPNGRWPRTGLFRPELITTPDDAWRHVRLARVFDDACEFYARYLRIDNPNERRDKARATMLAAIRSLHDAEDTLIVQWWNDRVDGPCERAVIVEAWGNDCPRGTVEHVTEGIR